MVRLPTLSGRLLNLLLAIWLPKVSPSAHLLQVAFANSLLERNPPGLGITKKLRIESLHPRDHIVFVLSKLRILPCHSVACCLNRGDLSSLVHRRHALLNDPLDRTLRISPEALWRCLCSNLALLGRSLRRLLLRLLLLKLGLWHLLEATLLKLLLTLRSLLL